MTELTGEFKQHTAALSNTSPKRLLNLRIATRAPVRHFFRVRELGNRQTLDSSCRTKPSDCRSRLEYCGVKGIEEVVLYLGCGRL